MKYEQILSELLTISRAYRGTKSKLARSLGTSQSNVSLYLTGQIRKPSPKRVKELEWILGAMLADIRMSEDETKSVPLIYDGRHSPEKAEREATKELEREAEAYLAAAVAKAAARTDKIQWAIDAGLA